MADEITYDRVEDAEQAILEAISGVGDTVNGLPASLETDFTEVKNAIADVKTDVGNVNTAVSGVKSDTSSIKNTVDTNPILAAGSAVKSVQRGTSINKSLLSGGSIDIDIANVDTEKSVLVCNVLSPNNAEHQYISISLEKNRIVMKKTGGSNYFYFSVSWQVIEFY